jgi:hypothetical protein
VDEYEALEVASVTFLDAHPSVIKLTVEDNPEAGDWIAYDTYHLNKAGEVVSLERTTNVLPGHLSRTEFFVRREGKLVRQSVTTKSLSTSRPVAQGQNWLPKRPLLLKGSAFSFWGLLQQAPEVKQTQPLCIEPPEANPRQKSQSH